MRLATEIGPALAFLFPGIIAGVHVYHLLFEKFLDRLLDLNLVSSRAHAKDVLVVLLTEKSGLFGEGCCFDDVEGLVHLCHSFALAEVLSASLARAPSVTKIFSQESNCSVFTSLAVASVTGLTLRA